jgi:hypothetical protein
MQALSTLASMQKKKASPEKKKLVENLSGALSEKLRSQAASLAASKIDNASKVPEEKIDPELKQSDVAKSNLFESTVDINKVLQQFKQKNEAEANLLSTSLDKAKEEFLKALEEGGSPSIHLSDSITDSAPKKSGASGINLLPSNFLAGLHKVTPE